MRPVVLLVGALFVIPGTRLISIKTFRASNGMSWTVRWETLRLTDEVEVSRSGLSPVTCTESVTCPSWSVKSAVERMPVLTDTSWMPLLNPVFSTDASYRPGFTSGKKKLPLSFVSVSLAPPVSTLRSVTLTPASLPPEPSVTEPSTVPTGCTCACKNNPASRQSK